jgi:hypothetical protein
MSTIQHNTPFSTDNSLNNVTTTDPVDNIASSNGTGNDNGIGNGTGALSKNDVNVDIDPDSKDNHVTFSFCSLMITLSCCNNTSDK